MSTGLSALLWMGTMAGAPTVSAADQVDTAGGDVSIVTVDSTTGVTGVTVDSTASPFFVVSATKLAVITPAKTAGNKTLVVTNAAGPSVGGPGITYWTNADVNTTLRLQRGNFVGDTWSDDSGNARHFTDTVLYPPETNKEAQFNEAAATQCLVGPAASNFFGGSGIPTTGKTISVSIMFRARKLLAPNATAWYLSSPLLYQGSALFSIVVTSSWLRVNVDGTTIAAEVTGAISLDEWHVVDVEANESSWRMRLDGGSWTTPVTATVNGLAGLWYLGDEANTDPFHGDVRGVVVSNVARGNTWFDQNLTWWKVKHGYKSATGEAEIDIADSDVFDPAGGDRVFLRGRRLTGASGYVGNTALTNVKVFGALAECDGTASQLTNAGPITNFVSNAAGSIGLHFYARTASAGQAQDAKYSEDVLFGDANGNIFVSISSGGTLPGVSFGSYDGATFSSVTVPCALGAWNYVQCRWDGTTKEIRVNGGPWVTLVHAVSNLVAGAVYIGRNFNASKRSNAYICEIQTKTTRWSDVDADDLVKYVNATYGTNYGGFGTSAFDPATSGLSCWLRPGYTLGDWQDSTTNNLDFTEGTPANQPRVSSGEHLVATVPAKSAGTYPLTIVNASGETALTGAIEYANPSTIPNCIWWLRPDAADVAVGGSGEITTWRDRSGIGDTNRNVTNTVSGSTITLWNAADKEYGGKPTVKGFDTGSGATTYLRNPAAWSTPYTTWTLGAIGHTAPNGNRYFTYGDATNYNSLLNESGVQTRIYVDNATEAADGLLIDNTGNELLHKPRSAVIAVVAGAASRLHKDTRATTGTLTAATLGGVTMQVGSYSGDANGVTRLAEVYAYSRAIGITDVRTLRRYRDSYYGKVA